MPWAGLIPLNDSEAASPSPGASGGSGYRMLAQQSKYVHALFGRPKIVDTLERKASREKDENERKILKDTIQQIKSSLSQAEEERKGVESIAAKEIVAKDSAIASMKVTVQALEMRVAELEKKLAISMENEEILITLL